MTSIEIDHINQTILSKNSDTFTFILAARRFSQCRFKEIHRLILLIIGIDPRLRN